MPPMEPIPETLETLDELDETDDADDLLGQLTRLAEGAQAVVPDLVGVSVSPLTLGLTFTLVASREEITVLDAVQDAARDECLAPAPHPPPPAEPTSDDILDEERWHRSAQSTAAPLVRSTLSLPVVSEEQVIGIVNLYAASARAFVGSHDALAEIFGAWSAGAVANADLPFRTREEARASPTLVRDNVLIDVATGILAAELDIDVDAAAVRLSETAAESGVSNLQLAREIVRAHGGGTTG